jgi:hypothetical protein
MNPLGDLIDFGSDFEFGSDNASAIEVEFKVKTESFVPRYTLSLTKTGRLSQKDMTKTAYYELVQDFVCIVRYELPGTCLRCCPLKRLWCTQWKTASYPDGQQEEMTILSVI